MWKSHGLSQTADPSASSRCKRASSSRTTTLDDECSLNSSVQARCPTTIGDKKVDSRAASDDERQLSTTSRCNRRLVKRARVRPQKGKLQMSAKNGRRKIIHYTVAAVRRHGHHTYRKIDFGNIDVKTPMVFGHRCRQSVFFDRYDGHPGGPPQRCSV